MLINDYSLYVAALSSCAIEGNEFAQKLLDLRKIDPERFITELERLEETRK